MVCGLLFRKVWGQNPHSPETGGSRGMPPALENLSFFLEKITEFLGYILTKINAFQT